MFLKKGRRRRKNFGVSFFQILTFFFENLSVSSGFQCLHNEKSSAQAKNLGTTFFAHRRRAKNFPTNFSFWSENPLKKFGDNIMVRLFKKFLCDMLYTHCVPTYFYLPVCSQIQVDILQNEQMSHLRPYWSQTVSKLKVRF